MPPSIQEDTLVSCWQRSCRRWEIQEPARRRDGLPGAQIPGVVKVGAVLPTELDKGLVAAWRTPPVPPRAAWCS
jgi:hypothetical protein